MYGNVTLLLSATHDLGTLLRTQVTVLVPSVTSQRDGAVTQGLALGQYRASCYALAVYSNLIYVYLLYTLRCTYALHNMLTANHNWPPKHNSAALLCTGHHNYHDVNEGYITGGSQESSNRVERKYILNQQSEQLRLDGFLAVQDDCYSRSRRKMFFLRCFSSCITKSHVNMSLLWILSWIDYNDFPDALIWLRLPIP